MPGKEVLNGESSSANGTSETFLFTSESVGEGHPGNDPYISRYPAVWCLFMYPTAIDFALLVF